jgi:hypothetical protein
MAPEWGAEVLRHWRSVLSALEKDPLSLAGKLDAYTKLAMFDGALWRDRFTWADVRRGMALVSRLRHEFPEGIVERVLSGSEASAAGDEQAVVAHARSLVEADGPGALERLEFVLRLQVLDLKYHELGGVFDDLRGAGYVENIVVPEADIERAITSPPPGGRAAQRAQLIRAHHGERGWAASWHSVRPAAGGAGVEMSHPFYVAETAVSVS